MKLFTVGPVEMYPYTLETRKNQIPYFRTDEFSSIMSKNEKLLKELVGTSQKSYCAFLTGSGTAAMEAVISNCFNNQDKVLIINGGTFGERFIQLCQMYKIPYDEIYVEYGETFIKEMLIPYQTVDYSAMLVNIHETSTGQLYDINILKDFCQKKHMRLVVDAISSFLSDPYQMDKYNIDCTIISSQKALALAPGLSMVVMNSSFYDENIERGDSPQYYLDLKNYVLNIKRGQTPFTPAVGICYELYERLNMIKKINLENELKIVQQRAEYFRIKALEIGLKIPDYPLSNTLTPIIFEKGNADNIYHFLKENYDIVVTPNGGKLKDTILRVGHIGNLSLTDYDFLISKIKEIL